MLVSIANFYVALTVVAAFVATSDAQDYIQDVPEACKLPPKRGKDGKRFDFWYYDENTNDCKWMAARSFFGNANRFVSRAACQAYCKYQKSDPCEAVTCGDKATCRSVQRTKCEQPDNTNEASVNDLIGCPPDFAVCEVANGDKSFRYPPIPNQDVYPWVTPARCRAELRTNRAPSNSTDLIPRMLVQYRAVDRKCKGFYVYPPAVWHLSGKSSEDAIRSVIEGKNAFFDLEECMSTCAA